MSKKVRVTETVLRDAHQSLLATRMTIDDMLPILGKLNEVGFNSIECWGGATFDACLRFLNEDPWERLRTLRREMPDTRLQMLFRGQNMLGYRHYADDVNDIRNLQTAINAAKKASRDGKKPEVQVAMSFTTGEVFTTEYYVEYAKRIAKAGADSICIKDMAALLTPYKTAELVKAIKDAVDLPVNLHTHYTSGLASMCLIKGVEAGADIIDTAMSPLALGTSHAPTESMVAAFQGTEYDTGLDLVLLNEIRGYFMELRKKYIESGLIDQKMLAADAGALIYQVPGGMLSNLLSQLKQAGKEDLLNDVLAEVPRVRADAGFPPLVTPSSQIVGTQAVFNVLTGERYKTVTKEFKGIVRGEYGQTPVPIDPEFRKKIIGDAEPIDCRPADLLEPELEKLRKECAEWAESEEDVLSYAQFGQVAVKFFEKRRDAKFGLDGKHGDAANGVHPV